MYDLPPTNSRRPGLHPDGVGNPAALRHEAHGRPVCQIFRPDRQKCAIHERHIDKFLNLSRLESGHLPVQLSKTDLVAFTRKWLVDYQEKNNPACNILFEAQCNECNLQIDTYLIEQVLNNLVSNGIKYSPDGSTLKIEIDTSDEVARITITDEGIGIPIEEQKNIFTSFFRASNARKAVGTGLGLAMVKQIVELHGGKIGIVSEENRGTRVTVELLINAMIP